MKKLVLASTCVAALAGVPGVAQAQQVGAADQAQAPAAAAPAALTLGLGDIVVTANRRSENLQKAPIAVTAVNGDALRAAGVTKPTELTAVVPALQVVTSAGPYSLFYLRGVGNFNGNALSDSAVAFNYDNVYIGRPSSTTGFFYDLDRIEVLKGPQGTLYGRNATGGAINVITHSADLRKFDGYINASYGNYNAANVEGAVNVPVGDHAALRFAGIYVRHDPYMSDGTDNQKDGGGRVTFRWDPTHNLKITLYGDYFSQRGAGPGSTPVAIGIDGREGSFSPAGQAYFGTQPVLTSGRNFAPYPNNQYLDNKFYGTHAVVELQSPIGTFTVIPAYRGANINFETLTPGFQIAQREHDNQFSVETRLASDDTYKLRYIFGAFWYDETNNVPSYDVNAQYNASFQNYRAKTSSMAVFGRLTYAITNSIRATVGGRYTTEDKSFGGTYFSQNRLCINYPAFLVGQVQLSGSCPGAAPFPFNNKSPVPATIPFNPAFPYLGLNEIYGPSAIFQTATVLDNNRRASFEKVTWRAGLDWDITSRNLLYASYETGFKSGGFFFSSDDGVFKPETIKAFTVGSKNRFFDDRFQINLEGFYWKYSNQQISHVSQDSQGNVIFATENVGKATFKGFEAETRFLATRNTELSADIQYLSAKYNSFKYQVPNQGPPFSACSNNGFAGTLITLNCSGFRPPNAPKWTLNLGGQQTVPLGNSGKIILNVRGHYQSRTLTGLEFLPIEYQPSYWLLDGSVTYAAPGDRLFVTGFINNALNKTVLGNTFPQPLGAFVVGSLRPPRTYGIRAGFKF